MIPNNAGREQPIEAEVQPALDWLRRAGAETELLDDVAQKVRRKRRRRRVAFSASALLGVFLVVGLVSWRAWRPESANGNFDVNGSSLASRSSRSDTEIDPVAISGAATAVDLPTTVSRPETRTLEDGTIVELNAGAELSIAFTAELRLVTLLRGEAHFQVAKNSQRPFVVHAGVVEARAVGTAFAVQRAAATIDVIVTEGRVQISKPTRRQDSQPASDAAGSVLAAVTDENTLLTAGGRWTEESGAVRRVEAMPSAQVEALLAWRVPQLEFSRRPLHEVIALLNQHAPSGAMRFEIADTELREIKLSGVLRADNAAGFERLLETSFDVRAERSGETIRLFRRR